VASARWRSIETALDRRAVQWLGRVSFSLYLVHEPIVVSVALLLPPQLAWAVPLISVPIALVVGFLFSKWVERPGHALAKAVGARIGLRRSSAARRGA
jgi:peptidoglycan/LPS O-acetylase OafA/YrhL